MKNPARQAKVIVNRTRKDATEGGWLDDVEYDLKWAEEYLAGNHAYAAHRAITEIVEDWYSNVVDENTSDRWPRIEQSRRAVIDWINS